MQRVQDIILDDIVVAYHKNIILNKIRGTFQSGSLTAVVGPNGGGKSTLLKAIIGMLPLKKGCIYPHITRLKKHCAYLPQISTVDRSFPLTVQDVVAMGLCQRKGFFQCLGADTQDSVESALASVKMLKYKNSLLCCLSGGQMQRILFARLSLQDVQIIFLDEPFAGIDQSTIKDLFKLITQWNQQGKTIIAVLHQNDLIHRYFSKTLILSRQVVAWGDTKTTLTQENIAHSQEYATRYWTET